MNTVSEFLRAKQRAINKITGDIIISLDQTSEVLRSAERIEIDEKKRYMQRMAQVITVLRRSPALDGARRRIGEWLLHAPPDVLRAIADELEKTENDLRRNPERLLTAYQSALEESDPRFRWWDDAIPERIGADARDAKELIQFPPTFRRVKEHFIVIFPRSWGWQKESEWSPRKTLTETYGLPLAKGKPTGRPKKGRNRRR